MEPERPIEKLLRAFAKKRRQDAGDSFKMPPATRRLLQGEVARRAAPPDAGGWLNRLFSQTRPGLVFAAGFAVLIFMAASLLLPGLSKAKHRSQMAGAASNLKQIGLATREYAAKNNQQLPQSLAEIQRTTGTNLLVDPASGKPFVYVAGGRSVDSLRSDSVLAYSPEDDRNRAVLFADGRVEAVNRQRFSEITNRGLIQLASASTTARRELSKTAASPAAPTISGAIALNGTDLETAKAEADRVADKKSVPEGTLATGGVALFDSAVAGNAGEKTKALVQPPGSMATVGTSKVEATVASGFQANRDLNANATATQQFAQTGHQQTTQNIFKNAAASAKITPVLANFQFQQNGSEVAVVDEDGSVYHGYLIAAGEAKVQNAPIFPQSSPVESPRPPQKLAKDFSAKTKSELPAQNYFFRVMGTNRSLQQNVVFTGNVLTFSNAAQNFGGSFAGGGGGSGGGNLSPGLNNSVSPSGIFSNSRIAGTAVVNSTNEIEINALPVPP